MAGRKTGTSGSQEDRSVEEQSQEDRSAGSSQETQASAEDAPASADARAAADAGTEGGAEARLAASTRADEGQEQGRALTQLEAARESAIAARQAATDSTIGAGAQTIQRPDPELLGDMTNDAKTAKRAMLEKQIRDEGTTGDHEKLVSLSDELDEVQAQLDKLLRRRDELRDAVDAESERIRLTTIVVPPAVGYVEAQNAALEAEARRINAGRA